MSKIIELHLDFDLDIEKYLRNEYPSMKEFRILSQSLDARNAPKGRKPIYHYKIEFNEGIDDHFNEFTEDIRDLGPLKVKPIIIGAGPAGLFCALRLLEFGIPSIIIERGSNTTRRMLEIAKFWRYGEFNSESNVCYGAGGAGLFSDGKLVTRSKSKWVQYVMNKFVEYGAPKEVAYISNPHVGSNKIRDVIINISNELLNKGCEIYYNTKVTDLIYADNKVIGVKTNDNRTRLSDHVILAIGHSPHEFFEHLKANKVQMTPKDFAIGVRIEHPREHIDKIQYGKFATHENLKSAFYRLSHQDEKTHKGTYSFCMCPGGYVLSSGSDPDGIVVNGMSNFRRNSHWSNSALVVQVNQNDYQGKNVLDGFSFIKKIENRAYQESKNNSNGKSIPSLTINEFLNNKINFQVELPKSSSPSGVFKSDIGSILPSFVINYLREALLSFNKKIPGFILNQGLILAPETRTSCPVTIVRNDDTCESVSHAQLYPCGEGAGYAGGITSAAIDGIKVANYIIKKEKNFIVKIK
ncbi:MAG: FAD-dependent oxidoreductase [Bacteriovoracaceae bacterium]